MRKAEVILEYQNVIPEPPIPKGALYSQACSNDQETIDHWQHIWLGQTTANHQRFGPFAERSISAEFNKYPQGAAIVAGSGPSLKVNAHELKNRGKIPLISCLHNFHKFEDLELAPEYYVTLDAGPVTIEEVTEGGTKSDEEYWKITEGRTLVAFIGTHPDLLSKWRGKILFFNAVVPSIDYTNKMEAIEPFHHYLSSGGNVLGACLYFAKAILGCHTTVFVGSDFSFGYDHKFHAWDSKYDATMGHTLRVTDIYGNKVHTWQSYYNFKAYFDSVALRVPGVYYNCSEGGCLGAYPEGNISAFRYLDLKECLKILNMNSEISDIMADPKLEPKKILYS